MLPKPVSSRTTSNDSFSELGSSTRASPQNSFRFEDGPGRDRFESQASASSFRGTDTNLMEKLRMRFEAYNLGGQKPSSRDISFKDRRGTLRERSSIHKNFSRSSTVQTSEQVSLSLGDGSSEGFDLLRKSSAYPMKGERSIVLTEEKKIRTQLRTYLKLSQTMGPVFVLNEKKRESIYEAIKMYHKDENIAQLAVTCLELLADKTDEKAVIMQIMKNFGNLAALVGTHVTNLEFSRNFLSLVVHILKKDEAAALQMDDPAYVEAFLQIKDEHHSNAEINQLFKTIADKLGIKISTSATGPDTVFSPPKLSGLDQFSGGLDQLSDSQSSAYGGYSAKFSPRTPKNGLVERENLTNRGSLVRTQSELDAEAVDEWANDDLIGNLDGDLVDWDSDEGDESVTKIMPKQTSPRRSKSKSSRSYTARRLKELQMQNAQRDQKISAYKEAVGKCQDDYDNMQNQYHADKATYNAYAKTMEKTDKKWKDKISNLKHENESVKSKEIDLNEQASKLLGEMKIVQGEMIEKNKQFENMKTMVTQQMNEAKGHYVGVRQRLEEAKAQLSKLQEMLLETENNLKETQKEQEKKNEEYNGLQTTYQAKQREYEEARMKSASLENRFNTIRADFSSKIANNHQELAKGQSNIRLAHQMHGTFKAQLMKLKMEKSTLLKQIQAYESLNSEGTRVHKELRRLKKENTDLKARLKDLMDKNPGGSRLKKLQEVNTKLKREKAELIQMTEMLLAKTES